MGELKMKRRERSGGIKGEGTGTSRQNAEEREAGDGD